MQDEIRKSGIACNSAIFHGHAFLSILSDRQDLIDILVPYFKQVWRTKSFCIWVTADNLTAAEARKAMAKALPGFTTKYLNAARSKSCLLTNGISMTVFLKARRTERLDQKIKPGPEKRFSQPAS